jgi:hypothetical protein
MMEARNTCGIKGLADLAKKPITVIGYVAIPVAIR